MESRALSADAKIREIGEVIGPRVLVDQVAGVLMGKREVVELAVQSSGVSFRKSQRCIALPEDAERTLARSQKLRTIAVARRVDRLRRVQSSGELEALAPPA